MADFSNNFASLEALLFVHGEPLSVKDIARVLEMPEEEARALIGEYGKTLEAEERGLMMLMHGEKVQLATKAKFAQFLAHFVKEELSGDLTPASVETLSLVAYLGPIPRAVIDHHRGVNSAFILRNLALRGLVSRVEDPKNANTFLYEASFELLKHLGIAKKEDLPEYEKFHELFEKKPATDVPENGQIAM
jgi:segregation and condensation protein B